MKDRCNAYHEWRWQSIHIGLRCNLWAGHPADHCAESGAIVISWRQTTSAALDPTPTPSADTGEPE